MGKAGIVTQYYSKCPGHAAGREPLLPLSLCCHLASEQVTSSFIHSTVSCKIRFPFCELYLLILHIKQGDLQDIVVTISDIICIFWEYDASIPPIGLPTAPTVNTSFYWLTYDMWNASFLLRSHTFLFLLTSKGVAGPAVQRCPQRQRLHPGVRHLLCGELWIRQDDPTADRRAQVHNRVSTRSLISDDIALSTRPVDDAQFCSFCQRQRRTITHLWQGDSDGSSSYRDTV